MTVEIWDDKYLVHWCDMVFGQKEGKWPRSFYRIDKQGYYYCPDCRIKIPGILFVLPHKAAGYYGYYGICPDPQKVIKIELL